MTYSQELEPVSIAGGVGEDGHEYVVRTVSWDLDFVEKAWEHFSRYEIFSDDGPKSLDTFTLYVLATGTIWFELYDITEEYPAGLIYVNGLRGSARSTDPKDYAFTSGLFHATLWDSNVSDRRSLIPDILKGLFNFLRLHRLEARVPKHHGGAIRALKRMGFKVEGELRQAVRYNGIWYDQLALGILAHEV